MAKKRTEFEILRQALWKALKAGFVTADESARALETVKAWEDSGIQDPSEHGGGRRECLPLLNCGERPLGLKPGLYVPGRAGDLGEKRVLSWDPRGEVATRRWTTFTLIGKEESRLGFACYLTNEGQPAVALNYQGPGPLAIFPVVSNEIRVEGS